MSNSQRTVRYRGSALSANEYRTTTSLQRLFKFIWVRKESYLDHCREKNIDPQFNELKEPIIPVDFQPKLSQVKKFRRKFNKTQKERINLFQAKYKSSPLFKPLNRRMTSMDDWYKEGLYLYESSTIEEYLFKISPELQDREEASTLEFFKKMFKQKLDQQGSLL